MNIYCCSKTYNDSTTINLTTRKTTENNHSVQKTEWPRSFLYLPIPISDKE